jgi:hypothetical protein
VKQRGVELRLVVEKEIASPGKPDSVLSAARKAKGTSRLTYRPNGRRAQAPSWRRSLQPKRLTRFADLPLATQGQKKEFGLQ